MIVRLVLAALGPWHGQACPWAGLRQLSPQPLEWSQRLALGWQLVLPEQAS